MVITHSQNPSRDPAEIFDYRKVDFYGGNTNSFNK